MAGELIATGVATAPGAGTAIATLAAPAAGKYRVTVTGSVSNNAVADLNNFRIRRGGVDLVNPFQNGANGNPESITLDEVDLDGSQNLTVENIGAGTTAIEYAATIEALRIS